MKAIRVHRHGGPEVLAIDELPVPTPKEGELLVRIQAASLNHMDLWVRNGMPGVKLPLPMILGCEAAGVVTEVGGGVKRFKKGDEVVLFPNRSCGACAPCREGNDHHCPSSGLAGETEDGVDAEYQALSERYLHIKPKGVTFEEAAAVSITFLTAWHMLVDKCSIKTGQDVLIIAASSGVGSAGVQIAKLHGARVIATVGGEEKLAKAKELGADFVIDHRSQEISREVKKITHGRGVDIVFEHVGQATWDQSLRSLAFGGKVVTCGATTGGDVRLNIVHLFIKHQQVIGSTMGPSRTLPQIFELVAQRKLRPVIDKVYPFSQVKEAHQRLEGRGQFGKIVLSGW